MTKTLAELRQDLAVVKARIKEIGGPKGDYCKHCGAVDVHWMFNVFRKGDAILLNDSGGKHHCPPPDDFEVVDEQEDHDQKGPGLGGFTAAM